MIAFAQPFVNPELKVCVLLAAVEKPETERKVPRFHVNESVSRGNETDCLSIKGVR